MNASLNEPGWLASLGDVSSRPIVGQNATVEEDVGGVERMG
jgi:hypothetical protein